MLIPSRIQLFSLSVGQEIAERPKSEKVSAKEKIRKNVDDSLYLCQVAGRVDLLMQAHMNIRSIFESEGVCQKRVAPRPFGRKCPSFLPFFFFLYSFASPLVRGGGKFLSSSFVDGNDLAKPSLLCCEPLARKREER